MRPRSACVAALTWAASPFLLSAQTPASGELIVFAAAVDLDLDGAELGGIHIMRPDGSGVRKITSFQTVLFNWEQHGFNLPDDHPDVSPDGRRVVFTSNRDGALNWELYLMDINGARVERLTDSPGLDTEPVFSPDGTRIAFASARFGNLDICVLDLQTRAVTRLTSSALEEIEPAWSPDGSQIAFARVQGFDRKDVFVMNADGSNVRQLTFHPDEDHDPKFAPNGLRLAITSERELSPPYGDVWLIDASNGGNPVNLTSDLAFGAGDPSWSPGGTRIAFFKSSLPVITSPQQLWVMNANGGNKQQLPSQGFLNIHPNWGIVRDSDQDGRADYLENSNRSYRGRDFGGEHAGDRFGTAIALADLTRDGFPDVAIGAPRQDIVAGPAAAGAVHLGRGSEFGIDFRLFGLAGPGLSHRRIDARFFGLTPITGGRFGETIAAGDFNGDGFADLAIGAPGMGRVCVLMGASGPIRVLAGPADFGAALAVGDFDRNGVDDLAVGAPRELRGTGAVQVAAGAVRVFYGSAPGGLGATAQVIDQGGLPDVLLLGGPESGDEFGAALAAGDLNGDGAAELVIGVPGESLLRLAAVGALHIVPGTIGGPLRPMAAVARDGRALPAPHGGTIAGARFGEVLAVGDFNRDLFRIRDLVVGVPRQPVGGLGQAGIVAVLPGGPGTELVGAPIVFTAADLGGVVESFARLGQHLAVGDLDGDLVDDLAVAAPRATVNGRVAAGRIDLVHGSRGTNQSCAFCVPNTVINLTAGGLLPASAVPLVADQVGLPVVANGQFGGSALPGPASVMAVADLDRDGQDDLFVGAPELAAGGLPAAGQIGVRYGQAVGTFQLEPRQLASPVDEFRTLDLSWTHPRQWREMQWVHLRLVADDGVFCWLRVDAERGLLQVFDPAAGGFGPEHRFGQRQPLNQPWVRIRLDRSQVAGTGPEGRAVLLQLELALRHRAEGRTFRIELAGVDDAGHAQAFATAGTWLALPRR